MTSYSHNFKLQKVLNYKENIENFKKTEFGNINLKLNKEEEILLNYNLCKEKLVTKKKESINSISIGHLKLYNDYLNDISSNIENQEQIIDEIKDELKKAKEELLIAMQERKSFDKLKEKKHNDYLSEIKKKEEKVIDEIISFNNSSE